MNNYQEEYNLIEKLVVHKIYFSNHANFEEVKEVTKALNSLQEAIDKANKYDDKETPNKPIKEIISDAYDCDDRNIDFEWERTKCPHCDDDLINEYENRDFEDYDYCPFCGGRLDWSDE